MVREGGGREEVETVGRKAGGGPRREEERRGTEESSRVGRAIKTGLVRDGRLDILETIEERESATKVERRRRNEDQNEGKGKTDLLDLFLSWPILGAVPTGTPTLSLLGGPIPTPAPPHPECDPAPTAPPAPPTRLEDAPVLLVETYTFGEPDGARGAESGTCEFLGGRECQLSGGEGRAEVWFRGRDEFE